MSNTIVNDEYTSFSTVYMPDEVTKLYDRFVYEPHSKRTDDFAMILRLPIDITKYYKQTHTHAYAHTQFNSIFLQLTRTYSYS